MVSVSKSKLKAKMFEYFRELEQNGGVLVVTDYGKPTLRIEPYTEKRETVELFADIRGRVKVPREIAVAPTSDEWSES